MSNYENKMLNMKICICNRIKMKTVQALLFCIPSFLCVSRRCLFSSYFSLIFFSSSFPFCLKSFLLVSLFLLFLRVFSFFFLFLCHLSLLLSCFLFISPLFLFSFPFPFPAIPFFLYANCSSVTLLSAFLLQGRPDKLFSYIIKHCAFLLQGRPNY